VPPAPTIVVVARAVVVVVVDTLSSLASLDGVPGIAVGPETALDRRRRSPDSVPLSLLLRRRRVQPWADGAPAHPRSERWREAELSTCWAATASSSAFNCSRTRRSSEVAGSGQPRRSMATAARFWDARQKSGGASTSAFAPSLVRRFLSGSVARAGGVGARPRGWSAAGWHSRRLPFSSRGSPCTRTSCTGRRSPFPSWAWPCTSTPCAGCHSRGSASMPSSRCRRVSSSSSRRLASASSSSRARRWSSAPRWCRAGSD
jgi:hypothetical protein